MIHQLLYNIGFTVAFVVTWPYFTYRMARRGRMWDLILERLGFYDEETFRKIRGMRRPVWIHAVSVGEMMIAQTIVREWRELDPRVEVVLTTTTQTGRQVGQSMVDERTVLVYNPTDFLYSVHRAFQLIRPSMLVLVEGEIWPNYIWCAERRGIPVCLVNARLSPRSWRRYRRFGYWVRPVIRRLSWVGVQNGEDLLRFAQAGFKPHVLFEMGSIKFDVAELAGIDGELPGRIRSALGWGEADEVLLAGSTHPGEERVMMRIFQYLRKERPGLRLVLAPRHVERADGLEEDCRKVGLSVVRRSGLSAASAGTEPPDVLLLDTTGELRSLYALGTINFIGKSLTGRGGQNFIEACRTGAAVLVGPHMSNFAPLTELFKQGGGLVQVDSELELYQRIRELLEHREERVALGRRAAEIFQANLGAARKTARALHRLLATMR
jgi:3-deoxy-D-manno-octulosonic-acid transferase